MNVLNLFYDVSMAKTITNSQLLGEIGEAAVRLRFLTMGFQFDGPLPTRSRSRRHR